eukprot:3197611-Pleurochrysis_carterae.AAC.4
MVLVGTRIGSEAFILCFLAEAQAATYARLRSSASLTDSAHCDNATLIQLLLLRHYANADLNHTLRTVTPSSTSGFALQHDSAVDHASLTSLPVLPPLPATVLRRGGVRGYPYIAMGGLVVTSAHDSRHAAYTASYMACLPRIRLLFPSLSQLDPEREPLPAVAIMHASLSRICRQLAEV